MKEQNLKNPTKKIANLENNKISKSKKPFPQEAKSQSKNENQNKIYCSICGHDIPKYIPMYFSGEKYNPACEDCKASDSSWDPDDPFVSFPSSAQPSSLVTHWIPISAKTPQRPGSISSMITHCALLPPPGSSFISMEEVLELMKEFLKKPLFRFDAT